MLHDFYLAGKRVRLWQRGGESYEHILMKALGFAMFASRYPNLEIETKIGLRYKPDLIARAERRFSILGRMRRELDSQNRLDFKAHANGKARAF
jgi:hypothetical protein